MTVSPGVSGTLGASNVWKRSTNLIENRGNIQKYSGAMDKADDVIARNEDLGPIDVSA
jgi:hypothetical protein